MSKKEREHGRKWDGVSRVPTDKYKENWEEIYGQKEQRELDESMKEAFRQRDERKKKSEMEGKGWQNQKNWNLKKDLKKQ